MISHLTSIMVAPPNSTCGIVYAANTIPTYLLALTDCVVVFVLPSYHHYHQPPGSWSHVVVVVVAVFGGGIQYLMSIPFNPFKPIRLHCLSINSSVVVNKWLLANIEIVY